MGLIMPAAASEFDDKIGLSDIDEPIPAGLVEYFNPSIWRILAMPVRLRRVTKGGIHIPDESLDAAEWHHQLFKLAHVGPAVYKGKAYAGFDIPEEEAPHVGDLWLIDPKQPRRFKYDGKTVLIISDDQLLVRVKPAGVDKLSFYGISL